MAVGREKGFSDAKISKKKIDHLDRRKGEGGNAGEDTREGGNSGKGGEPHPDASQKGKNRG